MFAQEPVAGQEGPVRVGAGAERGQPLKRVRGSAGSAGAAAAAIAAAAIGCSAVLVEGLSSSRSSRWARRAGG